MKPPAVSESGPSPALDAAAREASLRILSTQLPIAVWSVDSDLRIVSAFGSALTSRISGTVEGRSLADLAVTLGLDPQIVEMHREMLRGGGPGAVFRMEWDRRTFECTLEPLRGAGERVRGVVCLALDKTDRTRAETALRESEERYRTLAHLSPVGLFRCDREGNFVYVNEQWTTLTGLTSEQSRGRGWIAALHPLDRERVGDGFQEALRAGFSFEDEFRFRRPDGTTSWVLAHALPEWIVGGGVAGTIGTVTNITDRKEAEELLAFRQKFLARAAKGLPPESLFETLGQLLEAESNGGRAVLWTESESEGTPVAYAPSLPPDLIRDLGIFLDSRDESPGENPRAEYLPLTGFTRQLPGELHDWIGLGGILVLSLGNRGRAALLYPSADPASLFDRKLLETAAELVSLVLERRRREDIDRLNLELAAQNRRILEANRMKTEFMARMSHELRTPLNAIIGFSQLLADQRTGPVSPKQVEFLNDILQSGMHLLRIINDLLDLAKIEAGKVEARLEPVRAGDIISEVRDVLRPLAAQKGLSVEILSEMEPPEAMLDAQRFRQILYNLVSNAIKFTPAGGGGVLVSCAWSAPGTLEVRVRDQGIGIKAEDQSKLFQPFQQLDSTLPVMIPGSGLGLAICRQLVELHRGRIEMKSEPGRGSVFTAVFPEAGVPTGS